MDKTLVLYVLNLPQYAQFLGTVPYYEKTQTEMKTSLGNSVSSTFGLIFDLILCELAKKGATCEVKAFGSFDNLQLQENEIPMFYADSDVNAQMSKETAEAINALASRFPEITILTLFCQEHYTDSDYLFLLDGPNNLKHLPTDEGKTLQVEDALKVINELLSARTRDIEQE